MGYYYDFFFLSFNCSPARTHQQLSYIPLSFSPFVPYRYIRIYVYFDGRPKCSFHFLCVCVCNFAGIDLLQLQQPESSRPELEGCTADAPDIPRLREREGDEHPNNRSREQPQHRRHPRHGDPEYPHRQLPHRDR